MVNSVDGAEGKGTAPKELAWGFSKGLFTPLPLE
jgi:hypothetical protein